VSIKATYFFGAPVAEGQVRYTVSASPLRWFPFGDELEAWYEPSESYGGSFITRKVIPLGKDGTATFTVPTVTDPKRPHAMTFATSSAAKSPTRATEPFRVRRPASSCGRLSKSL
jgi:uncharacterized protein YfaS (alpha-2-macroglobulin family)